MEVSDPPGRRRSWRDLTYGFRECPYTLSYHTEVVPLERMTDLYAPPVFVNDLFNDLNRSNGTGWEAKFNATAFIVSDPTINEIFPVGEFTGPNGTHFPGVLHVNYTVTRKNYEEGHPVDQCWAYHKRPRKFTNNRPDGSATSPAPAGASASPPPPSSSGGALPGSLQFFGKFPCDGFQSCRCDESCHRKYQDCCLKCQPVEPLLGCQWHDTVRNRFRECPLAFENNTTPCWHEDASATAFNRDILLNNINLTAYRLGEWWNQTVLPESTAPATLGGAGGATSTVVVSSTTTVAPLTTTVDARNPVPIDPDVYSVFGAPRRACARYDQDCVDVEDLQLHFFGDSFRHCSNFTAEEYSEDWNRIRNLDLCWEFHELFHVHNVSINVSGLGQNSSLRRNYFILNEFLEHGRVGGEVMKIAGRGAASVPSGAGRGPSSAQGSSSLVGPSFGPVAGGGPPDARLADPAFRGHVLHIPSYFASARKFDTAAYHDYNPNPIQLNQAIQAVIHAFLEEAREKYQKAVHFALETYSELTEPPPPVFPKVWHTSSIVVKSPYFCGRPCWKDVVVRGHEECCADQEYGGFSMIGKSPEPVETIWHELELLDGPDYNMTNPAWVEWMDVYSVNV